MARFFYILLFISFNSFSDNVKESSIQIKDDYKYILLNQRVAQLEGNVVRKTELLEAQLINNDVKNQVLTIEVVYRELLDKQFKYIEALEERLTSHLERQDRSIDIVQDHTESYFGGLTTLLVFVTIFAGLVNVIFTKRSAIEVAREESEIWCRETVPKKVEELESKYKEDVDRKINSIEESTKEVLIEKSNSLELDFKKTIDEKINYIEQLIEKIEGYERDTASCKNKMEIELEITKEMSRKSVTSEKNITSESTYHDSVQYYIKNLLKTQNK